MKRNHGNCGMKAFRDAYCAVQTLLQAEGMDRLTRMHQMESWQHGGEDTHPLDLTLISILAHQLEHISENADEDPHEAVCQLAAIAELLLPAVSKRAEDSSDPVVRHAALFTRNVLTAVIEEAESPQGTDEEAPPPHEPGGYEAPATIRIPNNLQS